MFSLQNFIVEIYLFQNSPKKGWAGPLGDVDNRRLGDVPYRDKMVLKGTLMTDV